MPGSSLRYNDYKILSHRGPRLGMWAAKLGCSRLSRRLRARPPKRILPLQSRDFCHRQRAASLQKLRLADLRIPWLVFVFLWIDWVGERMKQFFWLGLNTLLPVVLAALCYLALCRDGVSWLRRSESV